MVQLLLLLGCSEYKLSEREVKESFLQETIDMVDILFVIDNSCSMASYQQNLANNFDSFLSSLQKTEIDYQIGVTTTTIEETNQDPDCAEEERLLGGELVDGLIIGADTENVQQIFRDLVQVGTCGSHIEMGLAAAQTILSKPSLGLQRDNAFFSVIFVSDEQDFSPLSVNQYLHQMQIHQRERNWFQASSVVVTDTSSCDVEPNSEITVGTRYIDIAERTNGVVANICDADFSEMMENISFHATRRQDRFFLAELPDVTSLRLEISTGEETTAHACDSADFPWRYQEIESDNGLVASILFEREKLPPKGAMIELYYNVAYEAQTWRCGE